MRTLSPLFFAAATLFFATGLHAAAMNKCVINGSLSYQQAPCPSTQARKDPTLDELNAAEKKRRATSNTTKTPSIPAPTASPVELPPPARTTFNSYRCDGRQHCSQMSSCAEAKFFLRNCPGVKMDGDNDGIPCEDQLCRP
jgi:Excalibur calcium-binding domain